MLTGRLPGRLVVISIVAFVIACGGGSPTAPPVATPAPVTTLVSGGSSSNLPLYVLNSGPSTESISWQVLVTTPG